MTRSEREHLEKRVVQHYNNIAQKEKKFTVNHFFAQNIPPQTIYSIIRKYEESDVIRDKARTGRPRKISNGQRTRLKKLVNHKTSIFVRQTGKKFNIHRRKFQRGLNTMGIHYRRKKRPPRYT